MTRKCDINVRCRLLVRVIVAAATAIFLVAANAQFTGAANGPGKSSSTTSVADAQDATEFVQEGNDGVLKCGPTLERRIIPGAAGLGQVQVSPPFVTFDTLAPGGSYRYCLSIVNRENDLKSITLIPIDTAGSRSGNARIETLDDIEPVGVGAWITPAVSKFDMQPGEEVIVPYRIDVPAIAPVGSNLGAIRVQIAEDTGAPIPIRASLLPEVIVNIPGDLTYALEITPDKIDRWIWPWERSRASYARFGFEADNQGNTVELVEGKIAIKGIFGSTLRTIKVPRDSVLRGGLKQWSVVWNDLPWIGVFSPTMTLETNDGKKEVKLPRMFIFPPMLYSLALLAAILIPVAAGAWKWHKNRMLLLEFMDDDEFWADDGDGTFDDQLA